MGRLTPVDRLLLVLLVPPFLAVFSLHLREIVRTGLVQPPVFAAPAPTADGHPTVGGFPLEVDVTGTGLRVGDRLIRVGDADLRGRGYLGFMGLALEQAGTSRRTALVIERDGARIETVLEMRPFAVPWFRVPFLVIASLLCVVAVIGRPGSRLVQESVATFMVLAIAECPFFGSSALQTSLSVCIFIFGGALAFGLVIRWFIRFPPEVGEGRRLHAAWALAPIGLWLFKLQYFFGGPVPTAWIPTVVSISDGLMVLGLLVVLTHNYVAADPIGRRRLKWLLYGFYLPGLPMVAALLLPLVQPDAVSFPQAIAAAGLLGALAPLGFVAAIVRFNLFDIDRIISNTVAYTGLLVLLAVAVVTAGPAIAASVGAALGVGDPTAEAILALGLGASMLPIGRRIGPWTERALYPDRARVRRGVQQLLGDLVLCRERDELLHLLRDRLDSLMRPERSVLRTWTEAEAAAAPPPAKALAGLLQDPVLVRWRAALQGRSAPLIVEPWIVGESGTAVSDLAAAERLALVLPLRSGTELIGYLGLGRKASGDVYTGSEIALFTAVIGKAAGELARIRAHDEIERERAGVAALEAEKGDVDATNRARSALLVAASRDLRQPLHALGLFAASLDREGHAEGAVLVPRIRESTRVLEEMMSSLLDLSQLEAGSIAPELSDFALGPLLERIHAAYSPEAEAKRVQLECEAFDGIVRSDPQLLSRILQNLVANAVRYTDRGRVTLRAWRAADGVRIEIRDTGRGIPEGEQREIFRAYRQLDAEPGRGLGLGLSIVERLTGLLAHDLELESEPGRGSCFTLSLPAGRETGDVPARGRGEASPLEGRFVAVVDPDETVREATVQLLQHWGCAVLAAATLEHAEAALVSGRGAPDAIVGEIPRPVNPGSADPGSLTGLRRALGAAVPAILVTVDTAAAPSTEAREAGVITLHKPVDPDRLLDALRGALR